MGFMVAMSTHVDTAWRREVASKCYSRFGKRRPNVRNHDQKQKFTLPQQAQTQVASWTRDFLADRGSAGQSIPTLEKEGRCLLALNAYRNGQFQTIRAAATIYNINYKTLIAHSKGQPLYVTCLPNGRKLIITEEKTLEDWILSLDARRLPTRV